MQSQLFKNINDVIIKGVSTPFQAVGKFISNVDWANINVATYVRYGLMLLSAVNTILTHFGKNPITYSEEEIYQVLTDVFTILILIVNTYKDNPTSKESIDCTDLQRAMKASEDVEEIRQMLQNKLNELEGLDSSDEEAVEDADSCEGDEEEV